MRLPNFFIAGAAKSGTTSLWRYLLQHPDIFMPSDIMYKEPAYFSDIKGMKDFNEYLSLFKNATTEKMIGEASAAYLTSPESAGRIRDVVPNAKIIIMLRNPIDRAYSLYNWMACNGYEPTESFEKALELEESNRYENKSFKNSNPEYYCNYLYFHSGLYSEQIKRFLGNFKKEQLCFIIFEKFKAQVKEEIKKVFKFLGVDMEFVPNIAIHNKGNTPLSAPLQFYIRQELYKYLKPPYTNPHPLRNKVVAELMELNTKKIKPNPIDEKTRNLLFEKYAEDVSKTSHLIGINLKEWWSDFREQISKKPEKMQAGEFKLESNNAQRQKTNLRSAIESISAEMGSILEQDITVDDLIGGSDHISASEITGQRNIIYEGSLNDIINNLEKDLLNLPRRIQGQIKIEGRLLHYADLHSFYYQAKQIFRSKLYDFHSEVDDPIILDCGAHIGLASIYFSMKYPNSKIYAYEADPFIGKLLKENIKSFNLQNVKAFSKAIWTNDDGVFFKKSGDDSGYVDNSIKNNGITVPSLRLRDLIDKTKIDLLKMDIEGSEYDVIEDCDEVLKNVKKIIVEVHNFRDSENSFGRLLRVLENNNFYYTFGDLHCANWLEKKINPPFNAVKSDKYIITVFAWQPSVCKISWDYLNIKFIGPRSNLSSNLEVVHLCSQDYGGAGKAAYRLHKGLQQIGVASKMLVINKRSDDPSVMVFPTNYTGSLIESSSLPNLDSAIWRQQSLRWETELKKYPKRPTGLEIFTDALSDIQLAQIRHVHDADIVNLHWVAGTLDYVSAPSALRGKTIVWTLHDMNPFTGGCHYAGNCEKYKESCGACPQLGSNNEDDLSRQIWKQKYYAFQYLDLNIVTPSKWLADCVTKSSLMSKFPVTVIPNGFPLDIFTAYPKGEIREDLKIPENNKVILFGAESVVNTRKGFAYLLEALKGIPANKKDAVVILTFGRLPEGLQMYNKHTIYSLGSIADENLLALAYSAADVFVIPSLEDNLPNTVVEAMACGIPVVGFNVGGIPDMIDHKQNGFLARPRDIASLIEGIEWALFSANGDNNVSYRCREKAETNFALELQANAYNEIYNDLMAKRSLIAGAGNACRSRKFSEHNIQNNYNAC